MVTIVTDVHLKEGASSQWDEVMRERLSAAQEQPGWIGGQLLQPDDDPSRRLIVGTWRTRDDWQEWHRDARFAETRRQLDRLVSGPEQHAWHDVVLACSATSAGAGARSSSHGSHKRTSRTRAG
jgi:heme-degrading monooxygenase HmoA